MIRIVLDTNVLAPGFASRGGASNRLLDHWRAGQYILVVSEHVLAELARAFEDPYYRVRVSTQQAEQAMQPLRTDAKLTPLSVPVSSVATRPEDDMSLQQR